MTSHDDIRTQLTAEALRVAAPIARTEIRGRVLEKGLNDVIEKIAALLEGGAVESAAPRRPTYGARQRSCGPGRAGEWDSAP